MGDTFLDRVIALLEDIEWCDDEFGRDDWCPSCLAWKRAGHRKECELDTVLKEARDAKTGG